MKRGWWLAATLAAATGALAETRALVVAGLGGTAEFESAFQRHARETSDALRPVAADVTVLLGDMATNTRLRDELDALASRSDAGDALLVVLIGHGSYDERDYRFNVPGPDVTGADLAAWLQEIPARSQLVVVATSASGALQPLLEREGRTLMTATRSGGERNASVFARYFSESLTAPAADTDKDGYIGAAEAFAFTRAQVAGYYEARREMATEHPTSSGSVPRLTLARLADAGPSPAAGSDTARLDALEADVAALRARKDELPPEVYYAELQRLLLDVAVQRQGAAGERGGGVSDQDQQNQGGDP